jgi:hypothetical protein
MLTKEQALTSRSFHYGSCRFEVGPRGGIRVKIEERRRNGATQTWKTRPEEWRVPVKYGMYTYGEITHWDAANWHVPEECPALQAYRDYEMKKEESHAAQSPDRHPQD